MKKIIILALLLILPLMASANERPTAQEIKKVMDFYNTSKDQGIVLVEHALTSTIIKKGSHKNEYDGKVDGNTIKKGASVYIWMNYMVPKYDKANVFFEFKRRGKVLRASELQLSGATRYRSWKKLPTNKTGDWKIIITQELAEKDISIATVNYTVID